MIKEPPRAPEKNQWMEIPLQVAHQYLPPPPAIDPDAPGPTAFANSDRVHGILANAGFSDITIDAFETKLPIGNDVAGAVQRLFQVGPASRLLSGASDDVLGQVRSDLGDAILDCQTGDGVLMECSTWVVNAEAGLAGCSHRSTSQ